jgi:hypothetical protein
MKDQLIAIDVNGAPADPATQDGNALFPAKRKIHAPLDILIGARTEKRPVGFG